MTPFDLISALYERNVSFVTFRNALKSEELPTSTGWEETIKKLEPIERAHDTKEAFAASIQKIHADLTLYCDKALRSYNLEEDVAYALYAALSDGFVEADSPYAEGFPAPLNREQLISAPLDISCVASWPFEGGENYLFCSKMYLTERSEIPADSLADEARESLGTFDFLVGVRRTPVQLYDSVCVTFSEPRLEIRLDGIKRFNSDETEKRLRRILQIIKKRYREVTGQQLTLPAPRNFFPALQDLYAKPDGVIGELGHLTDAAGIYKEKMRHKARDVRADPYHNGGAEAVVDLNIFSISKHWSSPSGHGYPEVAIPAHFAVASEQDPKITVIHVLNCASKEDYDFVMEKVICEE